MDYRRMRMARRSETWPPRPSTALPVTSTVTRGARLRRLSARRARRTVTTAAPAFSSFTVALPSRYGFVLDFDSPRRRASAACRLAETVHVAARSALQRSPSPFLVTSFRAWIDAPPRPASSVAAPASPPAEPLPEPPLLPP